jgi:hypothetical protein
MGYFPSDPDQDFRVALPFELQDTSESTERLLSLTPEVIAKTAVLPAYLFFGPDRSDLQ